MIWDNENGVWHGNKAIALDDLPNPLYILGYGSLIWRPGDLLGKYAVYPCECLSWTRVFSQKSSDHRGNPNFPGLVVTLVEEDYINSLDQGEINAGTCIGVVYLVPPEDADRIIAELDYRERGGYNRHQIKVKFLSDTPHYACNDIGSALVYTGSITNPHFSLANDIDHIRNCNSSYISRTAEIIATSIGPSGANCEYLFNLNNYFVKNSLHDKYISMLENQVKTVIKPWRWRSYMLHERIHHKSAIDCTSAIDSGDMRMSLFQWGAGVIDDTGDIKYNFPLLGYCNTSNDIIITGFTSSLEDFNTNDISNSIYNYIYSNIWDIHLFAGGSHSALLHHHTLSLFGKNNMGQLGLPINDSNYHINVVHNVEACGLGHDYTVLVFCDGSIAYYGNEKYQNLSLFTNRNHDDKIKHFSCGLRHSAGILASGSVCMFGNNSHLQTLQAEWTPPPIFSGDFYMRPAVVDIACGSKHTIFVDCFGEMWSFGDNTYGQLGRNITVSGANTSNAEDQTKKSKQKCDGSPRKVDMSYCPQARWTKV
jgi:cation transport regulator ChaC